MTNEIQVQEIPIETTFKEIRSMRIPDKDMVEAFAHSALRCVRMAIAENNIYSARLPSERVNSNSSFDKYWDEKITNACECQGLLVHFNIKKEKNGRVKISGPSGKTIC